MMHSYSILLYSYSVSMGIIGTGGRMIIVGGLTYD